MANELADLRERIRATDTIDLGVMLIMRVGPDDDEALEAIMQLVVRAEAPKPPKRDRKNGAST